MVKILFALLEHMARLCRALCKVQHGRRLKCDQ